LTVTSKIFYLLWNTVDTLSPTAAEKRLEIHGAIMVGIARKNPPRAAFRFSKTSALLSRYDQRSNVEIWQTTVCSKAVKMPQMQLPVDTSLCMLVSS
jgi:hypothetical protein